MDVKTQSDLLAAIITCSIAISLWLRSRKHRLHALFTTLNFNLSLYYFASFLHGLVNDETFAGLRMLIAVFIPLSTLKFLFTFLAETRRSSTRLYRTCVGFTTVSAIVLVLMLRQRPAFVNYLIAGYIFAALYLGVYLIYDRYRTIQSTLEATRLKYVIGGGLLATSLSLWDHIPISSDIFPILGTVATVLYMYLLSQVIIRFRLLDLYELLGRALVMVVLALIISVIYIVLVVWAGGKTGLFLFNSVIASAVVLILIDPLRAAVETRITRLIFFETYEFTRTMERLRRVLANVIHVEALSERLMAGLENSRRLTHASFYALVDEHYYLQSFLGPQPAKSLDAIQHQSFIGQLLKSRVIIRENLEQEIREYNESETLGVQTEIKKSEELLNVMDMIEADVSIACTSNQRVVGLINVRDDRIREAFSSEEIKALISLAAQATITIENSQAYETMRERDRLATLGQMAAGMAHEIRNPLGAIKGAVQLMEDELTGQNADFMQIVREEVDRLNKVVSQFLDYARPLKQHVSEIDLNELVRRTAQLLQASPECSATIQLDLDRQLPKISTDSELLRQVFLNFANNAFQAMPSGGTLTISTELIAESADEHATQARVKFRDTGEGMSDKVLKNIFIPFFTTKSKGTGLGLAISERIVSSLGGVVEVKSAVDVGTTVTVNLPIQRPALVENSQPSTESAAVETPLHALQVAE
ncbi:MAG: hypothetical protein KC609_21910 [Myxococcales bacterium]|nr:hypothetical protein [Myxococcales bacterium]